MTTTLARAWREPAPTRGGLAQLGPTPSASCARPTARWWLLAHDVRPKVEIAAERTRVMVEQLRALDVQRLADFTGRLSTDEMREVDEALSSVLALR